MAAPAPRRAQTQKAHTEDPPVDPLAIQRRLRRERAKRTARIEHRREQQLARIRFLALLGVLVFVTLFLSLSIWEKIQSVFGLS